MLQQSRLTQEMAHGFFFFNDPATTEIYTLSLHDALPIAAWSATFSCVTVTRRGAGVPRLSARSEAHTSELQSPCNLVCRLLLEKNNTQLLRGLGNIVNNRTESDNGLALAP